MFLETSTVSRSLKGFDPTPRRWSWSVTYIRRCHLPYSSTRCIEGNQLPLRIPLCFHTWRSSVMRTVDPLIHGNRTSLIDPSCGVIPLVGDFWDLYHNDENLLKIISNICKLDFGKFILYHIVTYKVLSTKFFYVRQFLRWLNYTELQDPERKKNWVESHNQYRRRWNFLRTPWLFQSYTNEDLFYLRL